MLDISFFLIGIGLAAMGYLIGDGLKNFRNTKGSSFSYPTLIKERDLHLYIGLNKDEAADLLNRYPGAPMLELKGTTYYPYQQFMDWLTSIDLYKK